MNIFWITGHWADDSCTILKVGHNYQQAATYSQYVVVYNFWMIGRPRIRPASIKQLNIKNIK